MPTSSAKRQPHMVKLARGTYYWCACGLSKRPPYCDGSHHATTVSPVRISRAEAGEVLVCACGGLDGSCTCGSDDGPPAGE